VSVKRYVSQAPLKESRVSDVPSIFNVKREVPGFSDDKEERTENLNGYVRPIFFS